MFLTIIPHAIEFISKYFSYLRKSDKVSETFSWTNRFSGTEF